MKKLYSIFLILFADIFLKQIALNLHGQTFSLSYLFSFQLFKNSRMAFSFNFLSPAIILFFSAIILLILFFIAIRAYRQKQNEFFIAYILIIAGALSNFFDRLYYGAVIDYLYIFPISFFNLADLLIGAGIAYLAYLVFKK